MEAIFNCDDHDHAYLHNRVIDMTTRIARDHTDSSIPLIRRLQAQRIATARNLARACNISTVVVSRRYRDIASLQRVVKF